MMKRVSGSPDSFSPSAISARRLARRSRLEDVLPVEPVREDYQGVLTIVFLLLVFTSLRLLLRNYVQLGSFIDVQLLRCVATDLWTATKFFLALLSCSFFVVVVHKLRNYGVLTDRFVKAIYIVFMMIMFVVPPYVLWSGVNLGPAIAICVGMCQWILMMKMHSYFVAMFELVQGEKDHPPVRRNVSFAYFLVFLAMPTLVYEHDFPRAPSVRLWWVAKDLVQCFLACVVLYLCLNDFIFPILISPGPPCEAKITFFCIIHDIVRLCVPSVVRFLLYSEIAWIVAFYAFFHCFCNALAEITRFSDRQFYLDWWNAVSLDMFWRKWNIPVHDWLRRHIYLESRKQTAELLKEREDLKRLMLLPPASTVAAMVTFLFSAIMHELVLAVCIRVLRPWFFLGMIVQLPLLFMSKAFVKLLPPAIGRRWGNIFVWTSLFLLEPLGLVLYLREWLRHHGQQAFMCFGI